jgi:hypothetical protein
MDLEGESQRCGLVPGRREQRQKTYLDGLSIQLEAFLLVGQELLDILTLISLKLNHLTHLSVSDDGAIASWAIVSVCFK